MTKAHAEVISAALALPPEVRAELAEELLDSLNARNSQQSPRLGHAAQSHAPTGSVECVSIPNALDVPTRLEELRALKNGWLEGEGKAPPADGLDWLTNAFGQRYPEDLVLPHLYPTGEGGVQAEWTFKPFEVSLEIDLMTHMGRWHSLDLATGNDEAAEIDLNDNGSWIWLANQVKRMAGGLA